MRSPIGPMGKHQLSVDTVCIDWIVSVLVCAVAVFGVPCFHKKKSKIKNQVKGQAQFFKAMNYFILIQPSKQR